MLNITNALESKIEAYINSTGMIRRKNGSKRKIGTNKTRLVESTKFDRYSKRILK
jgi:hypothetical protein